jgi:hypothetical protein
MRNLENNSKNLTILNLLFPREEKNVGYVKKDLALSMLLEVRDGTFTGNQEEFCKTHNCPDHVYYSIRSRLADFGLIEKVNKKWVLSDRWIRNFDEEYHRFLRP